MKRLGLLSVITAVALMTQGCNGSDPKPTNNTNYYDNSSYSSTDSHNNYNSYDSHNNYNSSKSIYIGSKSKSKHYSIHSGTTTSINDTVDKIAQQLLDTMKKNKNLGAVAITSFVDLHKLNKTTHFGRIMGESFFNALNKRGVNVMDFRGQKALSINADGEFFLSRDVKKLNSPIENSYVLVGTYSKIEEGVIINTRIIDNVNGRVIASSRVVYHSNDCSLFENCVVPKPEPVVPVRTINIVTDGCSTVECPCHSSSGNCSDLDGFYKAGHSH